MPLPDVGAAYPPLMPASNTPGMGAIPDHDSTTFRVWTPFAQHVHVAGTFNDWDQTATPLTSEGNGYWSADVEGAKVGHQYKFVITNPAIAEPLWRNDPYARELKTDSKGILNGVIASRDFTWHTTPFQGPTWNDMIIYELHIGSFLVDPESRKKRGTFHSLITKLDYLRDLGINTIEIMASGEFGTDISWGYNPAYIFAIESDYGGPNGFRELVNEAHRRGIAVLFDVVYNHLGPDQLDMWQFDGWKPFDANVGGIYFYNEEPRRKTPWGDTRPDYGRGEVRSYFRDNALRWLATRGADGLRWDATAYIRNAYGNDNDPANDIPEGWSLMQWINSEIQARHPGKISIAEDLKNNEWLSKDVGAGGAGFHSQWDAAYVYPIRQALTAPDDASRSMVSVRDALAHRYNNSAFERVIYTESHDEVHSAGRVPEAIAPGDAGGRFAKKRSTLGAALTLTAPGIPMLFQGQEFLEYIGFADDPAELDWQKLQWFGGIFDLYRDLIRIRRNGDGTTGGLRGQHLNVYHVNDADKLIAYHRWENGGPRDDVIVVANFGNRAYDSYTVGFPRGGLWKVRFNSDWQDYAPEFDNHLSYDTTTDTGPRDGLPYGGNIGIGVYSVIILSQDE